MKQIQNLSQCKWRFRNAGQETFYRAEVPGCIHTDLFKNKLIPDPFFGLNEKKVQWIEKENWEYVCEFEAGKEILSSGNIILHFKGLDTYAEVSLNGKRLFEADNMFIPWEYDVTNLLIPGNNKLRVFFHSPFMKGLEKYKSLSYHLPANNDEHEFRVSPFTRKAPYMYGWDWGPRLLTSGIWKEVLLLGSHDAFLENPDIRLDSLSSSGAVMLVDVPVTCLKPGRYRLRLLVDEVESADMTTAISDKITHHQFRIKISHPRLWWPRGFGDPNLYTFRLELSDDNGIIDEYELQTGIRTIELIREADDKGRSFLFRINGKDIFIRGANIIPVDYFVSGIKAGKYEELTDNAVAVNMNMLRAWGGAVYEDDEFYTLCDRKGIMVWQDFMFACGMYPSDEPFLDLVGREIKYQVGRLRNHPSVVLWCGNNEIVEGFHTWGWKEDLGDDAGEAYQSYKKVFLDLLPGILEEMDPERPYWPSSPYSGDDQIISLNSGDFHYWEIVKEILPITVYRENIGRFMSEYGFKSYPHLKTIESFAGKGHHDIHSELMESHQGWPGGAELVEKNLEWFYIKPEDFSDFIYLSQLLQAEAITGAIQAHRRAKPFCMGTLYWQLNDCWPSATWAGIDYYGRWKALHYHLKTVFSDVLISAEILNGEIRVYLISDLPEQIQVTANLRILDFGGKELFFKNIPTCACPEKATLIFSDELNNLIPETDRNRCFLQMNVFRKDHLLSHNSLYFAIPRELKLEEPGLQLKSEKVFDKIFLFLRSNKLAKNVYLDHPGQDGFFSDNFFDLLPGEEKIVIFQSDKKNPDPGIFTFLSLFDVFKKNDLI